MLERIFRLSDHNTTLKTELLAGITTFMTIIVGIMMMESVARIDFSDYSEAVPAFITIAGMPFTYSISNGIAMGFVPYGLIKALSGKARSVSPVMYVLALFSLVLFITSPVFK